MDIYLFDGCVQDAAHDFVHLVRRALGNIAHFALQDDRYGPGELPSLHRWMWRLSL